MPKTDVSLPPSSSVCLDLDVNQTAVALYKAGGVLKEDARILQKQDVDSDALPYLNEDSLTKMGIPTFGRRVKILKAAQAILSGAAGVAAAQPSFAAPSPMSATSPLPLQPSASPTRPSSAMPAAASAPPARRPSPENEGYAMVSSPVAANQGATDDAGEADEEEEIERDYIDPKILAAEEKAARAAAAAASGEGGGEDDIFATEEAKTGDSFGAVKPWIGAMKEPSKPPKSNPAAPDRKLTIDWVHGFRAFDSRSNLMYNKDGDIVYPVAGLCVTYNTSKKKQRYFQGHNDDVRCCVRHPTQHNLFASGQNATIVNGKSQPPTAIVWDSSNPESGKTYTMKFAQSDRAIRCVGFIGDGKYLVTVSNDDNHMVKVWDWKNSAKVAEAKGDANAIFQVRGNPKDASEFVTIDGSSIKGKRASAGAKPLTFYSIAFSESGFAVAGAEDGNVYIFKGGVVSKTLPWHPKGKVLSIEPFNGGFISGGSDKTLRVWDSKLVQSAVHTFSEHVTSVFPSASGSDVLVGTKAGDVFEIRDFLTIPAISGDAGLDAVTRGHKDGELWALAVVQGGNNYVTAGEDNTICLWDVNKRKMLKRAEISDKKGKAPVIKKASTTSTHPTNQCARGIAVTPDKRSIIVGTNNGEVAVFDTKTLTRKFLVDLNSFGKRQVTNQTGQWNQRHVCGCV
jgi:WD40 repeat protein